MAWPPIDEKLKVTPIEVRLTEEEISFHASDPTVSLKLRSELTWFFQLSREDQARVHARDLTKPPKYPDDMDRYVKESLAWDAATEKAEADLAPVYTARRVDNDSAWEAIVKQFGRCDGKLTGAELIDRAMTMKLSLPETDPGFFHSYIA